MWQIFPDVSEELFASIFRVVIFSRLLVVTSQNTAIFILALRN
jgi:hypothetical protein